jgi:hypothetical protein
MNRLGILIALVLSLAFAMPVNASTGDRGYGYFWVFDGLNGSGQWSGFGLTSGTYSIPFSGSNAKFTGNCPDITGCAYMSNRISSIKLSCGSAASTFGPYDEVWLYNSDTPGVGTPYVVTTALASCSNGVRLINLPSSWQNVTSSMIAINSNG